MHLAAIVRVRNGLCKNAARAGVVKDQIQAGKVKLRAMLPALLLFLCTKPLRMGSWFPPFAVCVFSPHTFVRSLFHRPVYLPQTPYSQIDHYYCKSKEPQAAKPGRNRIIDR